LDTDTDFENAKKLVEATIVKLGLDPGTCVAATTDAQAAWTLKRGSASVLVTVTRHEDQDETFLRVASPVVTVPADKAQHGALFRRLLEINAAGLANAAFGLVGERVVVVSERPVEGLGAEEVEQTVRHLAAVADTFDDRLEKEFGAPKA
jgi:anti-sigma factor RsiW